jgi:hypothetical protein
MYKLTFLSARDVQNSCADMQLVTSKYAYFTVNFSTLYTYIVPLRWVILPLLPELELLEETHS